MAFEGTSCGQDWNTRQLPAVNVAKTLDAVQIVAVTCSPIGVDGVVGTQVDHAKRASGGVEKKPPGVGRVKQRIDEVYGGFGGVLGKSHLTLKKEYNQKRQACC